MCYSSVSSAITILQGATNSAYDDAISAYDDAISSNGTVIDTFIDDKKSRAALKHYKIVPTLIFPFS